MKTRNILLTIVVLTIALTIRAEDFRKKIHKEYSTNDNTLIEVSNKYGSINITDWDKNLISIDVTITVDAKDEDRAQKYFDDININFSESSSYVKAETEIDGTFNNIGFSIDYEIKMPKNLKLNLSNRYGAVFINELTNIVDISVKYGSLKINKLTSGKTEPKSMVSLAYSKGDIQECNWLKLGVSYSKLDIEDSRVLMIESKYSKLDIEKASTIVVESKYDTPYNIGEVNNFVCIGKYSKYNINKLNNKLDIEISYSNVDVEEVAPDFKEIDVETRYGNVLLGIPESASYELKASADYGSVHYPDSEYINKTKDNTSVTLSGTIGKDKNTKSKVTVSSRYGSVNLRK